MRIAPLLLSCLLSPWLYAQDPAAALAAALDTLCQPLLDADLAVGFVVGVQDGETSLVRGYGRVARGKDAPPDGNTLYEIGSCSKVFTGLLLADAVQRGLVQLDDPVQKHLPDEIVMPTWEDQTVRLWHLSTHSSGLPRLPDMQEADPQDPYAHFTSERLLAGLGATKLRAAPGARYEYSNLGTGLLGEVLVRVAGAKSFDALLRERITGPLQMVDTAVALDGARQQRLAPPYSADGELDHVWDLAALAGAGGIRSSLHDLLKFARLQLAPAASPLAAAVALTQQQHFAGKKGPAVGLGWHLEPALASCWHNGQTGGYHSYFTVVPAQRRAVVVLANCARGEFDRLGAGVLRHLRGEAPEPWRNLPVAVSEAALQRLTGRYRLDAASSFVIERRDRRLFAQLAGQPSLRVYPRSPTEFAYQDVEASLSFELDGEEVKALVLHQNGKDTRCERVVAK